MSRDNRLQKKIWMTTTLIRSPPQCYFKIISSSNEFYRFKNPSLKDFVVLPKIDNFIMKHREGNYKNNYNNKVKKHLSYKPFTFWDIATPWL